MKKLIIDVNSLVLYVLLVVFITGLLAITLAGKIGILQALALLALGFTAWAILSGFWFVQVAQLEELKKLNRKGK